jgi:hypothetical protein
MSAVARTGPVEGSAGEEPLEAAEDLRCRVTISRCHESDAQMRQVLARLDDGPQMTLMFGETFTIEVEPGRHLLRANNTLFWKRLSFTAEPGEHIEFILINRPGRLTIGFLTLMGVAPLYLRIVQRSVV